MHFFLPESNLRALADVLSAQYEVYNVAQQDGRYHCGRYNPLLHELVISEVRASDPLKMLLFRARERVAVGFEDGLPGTDRRPMCVIGAKACDLAALAVLDHVFLGDEFAEPFYARERADGLVVSTDCTNPMDSCFCLCLGVCPYPREAFDINLSLVTGGFLVETGSDKGTAVIEGNPSLFDEPTADMPVQRDMRRAQSIRKVEETVHRLDVPILETCKELVTPGDESSVWMEEASTCVECGACNTICPTCHCFLLFDQEEGGAAARFRVWDSCLLKGFARVAGGGNPRPALWMRLRNRFEKKFGFFPVTARMYACTGCGRCVEACPGKIDIRRILARLVENGREGQPISAH